MILKMLDYLKFANDKFTKSNVFSSITAYAVQGMENSADHKTSIHMYSHWVWVHKLI